MFIMVLDLKGKTMTKMFKLGGKFQVQRVTNYEFTNLNCECKGIHRNGWERMGYMGAHEVHRVEEIRWECMGVDESASEFHRTASCE